MSGHPFVKFRGAVYVAADVYGADVELTGVMNTFRKYAEILQQGLRSYNTANLRRFAIAEMIDTLPRLTELLKALRLPPDPATGTVAPPLPHPVPPLTSLDDTWSK